IKGEGLVVGQRHTRAKARNYRGSGFCSRGLQPAFNPVYIDVCLNEFPDRAYTFPHKLFLCGEQTEVPLMDFNLGIYRQPSEDGHVRHRVGEDAVMPLAANAIDNDAREFYSRIERLKSSNKRCSASRHPMCIDNKDDRET